MQIDTAGLDDFADGEQGPARITAEVVKQAKELEFSVYANNGDMFEGSDLGKHRVYTFHTHRVNSVEGPTAHGERYEQHVRRAALATAIDKSAHICKPNVEQCEDYGWTVQSMRQAWPQHMMHTISCGCTTGCS